MTKAENSSYTLATLDHYGDATQCVSPLSLYSQSQQVDAELRAPHAMSSNHWHGQVEINIPFGDDVDYVINGELVTIKAGHVGLFWATVPHRLLNPNQAHNMGILNIPIHLFLTWPLNKEMVNQITHGLVLQSDHRDLVCEFELKRWCAELVHPASNVQQLATDEISMMLKRLGLVGWEKINVGQIKTAHQAGVSKHAQQYVSQMLEFIARNYDSQLTVKQVAEQVTLNQNYASEIFQRVMQMTIKQYVTTMRINHARALLSDTDKSTLDISLTVGFNSNSRFYDTFQRYVGVSPQKYRKLARAEMARSKSNHDEYECKVAGASDGKHPLAAMK